MKATLDFSGLRGAIAEAIQKISSREAIDEKFIDAQTIDHLQDQFDVEGMTEDGATGTFTRNNLSYDLWKMMVYGEPRRMHKTQQLREAVAQAPMEVSQTGNEITFEWSWDAVSPGGLNYADKYQNDPDKTGRRLVLTDKFLEDLADEISADVADQIERALA